MLELKFKGLHFLACASGLVLDTFAIIRQRTAAVKGQESETGCRKQLPAPNGNNELQQRQFQVNPKNSSKKFTAKEDVVTGFPIDPPGRAADNGQPQHVALMNAGRSSSTLGRSSGADLNAQRLYTPQIVAAEMSNLSSATGQRGNAAKLSNLGDSARKQYLREHRSSSRYSQLTAADPSDRPEWVHEFQERPSSSHRKDDGVANKEPTVVNGSKKNRIHYSGPLMPPGVNMEETLREHERQIQQAVRRARIDKGKGKHYVERDHSESLLYTTQNGKS